MPLISKPNYNQIFASQAPDIDKPAVFNNYPEGWGPESRPNNGKPTIKGFNYLQQTSDLKDLWILQNGACLPYDETIEYAEGAPVLKDGIIQYKTANGFKSRDAVTIPTYNNTADGVDPVTGVADGAYFNVRSSDNESYIDEYQNIGGSSVATGKSYPSSDAKWNASSVTYGAETQEQVNDNLLGNNGSEFINLTLSNLTTAVRKSLYDVVYDQLIDVTWFGANGNWNKDTQTGHNSTVAVQNAITYLATLGTRRQGGKRGLKFPKGSFRVDDIALPAYLGFGIDIIGDGVKTTNLYFDHTSLNPAIDCEIEFVQFRNITLIGSLDETWVTTRTPCYKARLPDGRADIDVTFFNCMFSYWNTVAQIHGRGCVFESCMLGPVICGMDIVVEDYSHGADTNLMQSKFATMRHYNYRNCRFDNCSRAYKVSGAGDMIDFINNGMFIGNDITNMDVLIEAPNAQLVSWCFGANVALGSFATSAIKAKALHMSNISQNVSTKTTNYLVAPTANINATEFFVDVSAPCSNLTIANNTVRGISRAFYRNTSTSPSKSVSIYGNNLPEFGAWKGGNNAVNFIFTTANHLNFLVKDNNFSCSNISGIYYLFNFNNNQQAKDIIFKDNTAPFTWEDRVFSNTPTVYVGGVATTGTSTFKLHHYVTDGDYVHGHLYFSGTLPESSGDISISLPVPAIALLSTFGATPSGIAKIITATGVVSTGFMLADALVNSASQRIELRKQKDTTLSNITAADVPAILGLCLEYKYRFK